MVYYIIVHITCDITFGNVKKYVRNLDIEKYGTQNCTDVNSADVKIGAGNSCAMRL